MRIAVVDTNAHGGLLHYAVQLSDALAERGHDVTVLLPRKHELSGHEGSAHLRGVLTPHVRSTGSAPRHPLLYQLRRGVIAARLLRSGTRVLIEVLRGRYDAVIVQWDLNFGLFALITRCLLRLRRRRRPTLGYVLHNVRPFNRWGGDDLFLTQRVARLGHLLPRFDLVFVHGERSRAEYEQTYPPSSLAVVPHGDERLFGTQPLPPSKEPHVLFFGDWRKVKGLDLLMSAFDLLLERCPDAMLTIAGTPSPGDYDDRALRRWARERGRSVTLVDRYVPVADVQPLFRAARVVCTPYLVGYQSGVLHLAMTMGRAVVTSDVGDLPAAVGHGECGLVVPPGDAAALADALEQVLDDPALAARLGEAGHARARAASSWEAAAEQVEQALLSRGTGG